MLIQTPLDYEAVREHVLSIQARDGGTPPLSSATMVTINVTDSNDNPPMFAQEVYAVTLVEDISLHSTVIQVRLICTAWLYRSG